MDRYQFMYIEISKAYRLLIRTNLPRYSLLLWFIMMIGVIMQRMNPPWMEPPMRCTGWFTGPANNKDLCPGSEAWLWDSAHMHHNAQEQD